MWHYLYCNTNWCGCQNVYKKKSQPHSSGEEGKFSFPLFLSNCGGRRVGTCFLQGNQEGRCQLRTSSHQFALFNSRLMLLFRIVGLWSQYKISLLVWLALEFPLYFISTAKFSVVFDWIIGSYVEMILMSHDILGVLLTQRVSKGLMPLCH